MLFRWLQELSTYHFTVCHVPGKDTGAADGLSRSTHLRQPTAEEIAEAEEYIGYVGENEVQLDRAHIVEAQKQDEVIKEIRKWVKGSPPSKEEVKGLPEDFKHYYQLLGALNIEEGDILTLMGTPKFQGDQPSQRIVMPNVPKL